MRILVLTLGPPIIVAVCYWLALWGRHAPLDDNPPPMQPFPTSEGPAVRRLGDTTTLGSAPAVDCRAKAAFWRERLGPDCRVIVRPPFILAGDLSEEQLDRYHQLLVRPIARALSVSYFDVEPDQPVTILIFSSEEPFRRYARQLDGRSVSREYGYYQRSDHRIAFNAATGNGTLAHELTHALAQFDFPNMPWWFEEGLATVHEQCEFSDDRLRLSGLSNWRKGSLIEAIRGGRLGSLESLITRPTMAREQPALDYAHTRYFCLYLQHRRLLAPFYRKFRGAARRDPTGIETLRRLLGVGHRAEFGSLEELDRDFRRWVLSLERPVSADAVR